MVDLESRLYDWVAADLIRRDEASAILSFEEAHHVEVPPPSPRSLRFTSGAVIASCLALVAIAALVLGIHLPTFARIMSATFVALAVISCLILGRKTVKNGLPERIIGMLRVEAIVALSLGFGTILAAR